MASKEIRERAYLASSPTELEAALEAAFKADDLALEAPIVDAFKAFESEYRVVGLLVKSKGEATAALSESTVGLRG